MNIKEMKNALAERDAEQWDYKIVYDVALSGCQGYDNMTDKEITSLHDEALEGDKLALAES